MRLIILALALSGCATTTAMIPAEAALRMCQADPATALAIAERYADLTPLDGAAIVRAVCAS